MKFKPYFAVLLLVLLTSECSHDSELNTENQNNEIKHHITKLSNEIKKERWTNSENAIKLTNEVISLSLKIEDKPDLAYAYYNKANIYQSLDVSDSAFQYFTKSLKIAEGILNDSLLIRINNGFANFYLRNESYIEALNYLNKALSIAEKENDSLYIGLINNGFGIIYMSMKEYDKALTYFTKAENTCIKLGDVRNATGIKMNIANCYFTKDDIDQALNKMQELLKEVRNQGDSTLVIHILINIGDILQNDGKINDAMQYFKLAKTNLESINNPSLLSTAYQGIGLCYLKQNSIDNAYVNLKKALASAFGTFSKSNEKDALNLISQIEEKRGNFADALEHYKQYTIIRDSIMNGETQKKIASIQWKFNYQKKENENILLQKKVETQRKQNYFIASILIGFVIIASLVGFMIKLSHKNLINTMKLKEVENKRLQEKIETEKKINEIEKKHYQTEIETKNAQLTTTSLQLLEKNEMLMGISDLLNEYKKQGTLGKEAYSGINEIVKHNLNRDKDWNQFKDVFEKVHHNFFKKLKSQFSNLSENELRLCAYIRSNLQNKEIAQMLNVSPSTVNISRYRIRKKMQLEHNVLLEDILRDISS